MKLTKQQLIKVIKEELDTVLIERPINPMGKWYTEGEGEVHRGRSRPVPESGPPTLVQDPPRRRRPRPTYVSTVGPATGPMDPGPSLKMGMPILWDGDTPYIDPRFMKDFSTYEQDVEAGRAAPSWEEAREAGDAGWGWGSLEENMLAENGARSWEEARGVAPWPGMNVDNWIATHGTISDIFPVADWAVGGDVHASPSWEEAIAADQARTQHDEREREYLENPLPWEHTAPSQHKYALRKAREAGETGWGPGSLEETIQKKLASLLKDTK